ncbi:MAG: acyl-CoA dehydrogenase family protein [Candidatus Omnitrophota bacterium]
MDYQLSPQEVKMQQDLAAFCRTEIAPRAMMLDGSSRTEAGTYMKENLKTLAQSGWLEPGYMSDFIDLIAVYLAGEEIAKACPATFLSVRASTFLCAGALRLFGTLDQKQRYIPDLMKAERIGAFAYSEEQAGSDMAAITTLAHKDGETWRLNGEKNVVVNAPIADVFLVLAYSEKDAGAEKGMSIFICEKDADGLKIGEPVETMGLRGVPLAGISMNNCVAAGILGGTHGKGYEQVTKILTMGKVGIAALCVGIGNACTEISVKHSKERKTFGKPIGLYQDVGFRLADMFTINDLGRMLALRAAWAINTGEHEADIMAACAKLFASEAVTKIANWGMQIFAGHGYVAGSDIERLYRDARFGEICEGASEIQRSLIAGNELDKFLPR